MSGLLLLQAHACHLPLADHSVHTVITSPPYLGLRAYHGVAPSCWPGGRYCPIPGAPPITIPGPRVEDMAACPHEWEESQRMVSNTNGLSTSTLGIKQGIPTMTPETRHRQAQERTGLATCATCLRCGCWRGLLGNEDTPARYVWHTLLWLREVKRVLREDGVAWVVLGDSFSSGDRQGHGAHVGLKQQTNRGMNGTADPPRAPQPAGYPQGCLLGIPAQIMLAAMADGWVCRNDVIWAKKSPMPESVSGWRWQPQRCRCLTSNRVYSGQQGYATQGHRETSHGGFTAQPATKPDPACPHCGGTGRLATTVLRQGSWRHTRSHETILMLTKGMNYFANSEAVREEATMTPQRRTTGHSLCTYDPPGRQAPSRGDRGAKETPGVDGPGGRNPRSVVTPSSTSLGLDHYASFPAGLIEPLIQATCPARCCPQCGQGWAPTVTHVSHQEQLTWSGSGRKNGCIAGGGHAGRTGMWSAESTVHGLHPTCPHYCTCTDDPCTCGKLPLTVWVPGLVLDCFAGSATTLLVSRELGRRAIGIELSGYYLRDIARARLGLTALAQWEGRQGPPPPATFDDLPLFTTQKEPL